jgi:hypothetical protein
MRWCCKPIPAAGGAAALFAELVLLLNQIRVLLCEVKPWFGQGRPCQPQAGVCGPSRHPLSNLPLAGK